MVLVHYYFVEDFCVDVHQRYGPEVLFSFLIAWAITSNTMLKGSGERGHPCRVGFQGECFQLLPIQYNIGCGFALALIVLRYVPSISSLLRVFNMKGC